MKRFVLPVVIVFVTGLCVGCASEQKIVDANGSYRIEWSGDQVTTIDFRGQKIPEWHWVIRVVRDLKQQTVLINDKGHGVWSKDLFASGFHDAEGSAGDIRFQETSEWVQNDMRDTKEWRLIKQDIVLYREVKLCDERGCVKQRVFFGPFDVLLKPPVIQSVKDQ
jgi:hypothetical protein